MKTNELAVWHDPISKKRRKKRGREEGRKKRSRKNESREEGMRGRGRGGRKLDWGKGGKGKERQGKGRHYQAKRKT